MLCNDHVSTSLLESFHGLLHKTICLKRAVPALELSGCEGTITLEVFCDALSVLFWYWEVSRRRVLDLSQR